MDDYCLYRFFRHANRGATLPDFQSAGKPLAKELLLINVIEIWGAIKSAQLRISRPDIPSRPAPLDLFSFLKKRQNLIAISGDELESFTKARGIILKTRVIVDRKVFRLPVWGFSPAFVFPITQSGIDQSLLSFADLSFCHIHPARFALYSARLNTSTLPIAELDHRTRANVSKMYCAV